MLVPGRILVIDHLGHLDRFVCDVLGQEQWYIFHADNIYDSEKLVYSDQPDIIIINAHLPQLKLPDFTRDLRERVGDDRPKVILAISREPEKHMQAGVQAQVDDYLIVPFYGIELLAKITNFMREKFAYQQRQTQIEALREQIVSEKVVLLKTGTENTRERAEQHSSSAGGADVHQLHLKPKREIQGPAPAQLESQVKSAQKRYNKPQPVAKPAKQKTVEAKAPEFSVPAVTYVKAPVPPKPISAPKVAVQPPVVAPKEQEWTVRKKMTLMVLRINHFDALVDELDPEQSVKIVNDLYRDLTSEIVRLGGRVSGIQGDTITCLFSSSTIFPNHRISAIQAALQLQLHSLFFSEKISVLTARLTLSVVLHSAMLTLGSFNKQNHQDTTIVGSVLPFAMRLLEQCPEGAIVATHECYGEVRDYVCVSEEFQFSTNPDSDERQIKFALITGINANAFVYRGDPPFKAS